MKKNKIWKAAMYTRLSREDGDREESDSISNQKALISQFIKAYSDVQIVSERVDDGYTGVNFDRPDFQFMMEDIKKGKINCIIVKDLARFSRDWIECGNYIERIFPFLGVRFIAVNDNVDTIKGLTANESIVIPFKNLINQEHPHNTSISTRTNLRAKQTGGCFTGNFCPYGYRKDEKNHNKLVIDEKAAEVVRHIFRWRIEGYSQQAIANKLNDDGVPSPLMYKKENGENYKTPFQIKRKTAWTAVAVKRILENEVYLGTLAQGKVTTPSYKVKKRELKDKQDWIRVEDTHEPIVSKIDYAIVNKLIEIDTRTAPNEEAVYPFSGMLFCADCGGNMVRKTVPSKGRKYYYYVCANNKYKKICSAHRIKEDKLADAVLGALQKHVKMVLSQEYIIQMVEETPYKQYEAKKVSIQLQRLQKELEEQETKRFGLYDSFKDGTLTKEEYISFKVRYDQDCSGLRSQIDLLELNLNEIVHAQSNKKAWIETVKAYANIDKLTRKTVVMLIDRILVYSKDQIHIQFKYQSYFDTALENANEQTCMTGGGFNG